MSADLVQPGTCESHPLKVAYPTQASAKEAVRKLEQTGYVALAFHCNACGFWHVDFAIADKK